MTDIQSSNIVSGRTCEDPIQLTESEISQTAPALPQKKRVAPIDVTRGTLMVMIIIIHANATLGDNFIRKVMDGGVNAILRLGTPGFTLVSGLLLGYFVVIRNDMQSILKKYAYRGMMLLLTTHALIAAAIYLPATAASDVSFMNFLFSTWYITDTLAIIFICFAPVIVKLSARTRIVSGISLLAISHLLYWGWSPASNLPLVFKEVLTGVSSGRQVLRDTYPLLPITAMFLLGTVIGERYAIARRENRLTLFAKKMLLMIVPLIGLSVCLIAIWACFKWHVFGLENRFAQNLFYPHRSFSAFPAYLALFLFIFWFWVDRLEIREVTSPFDKPLLIFGQTSLFTYCIHYYIVQTTPYLLGQWKLMPVFGYLMLIGIGLPVTYSLASFWNQRNSRRKTTTTGTVPLVSNNPSVAESTAN